MTIHSKILLVHCIDLHHKEDIKEQLWRTRQSGQVFPLAQVGSTARKEKGDEGGGGGVEQKDRGISYERSRGAI